MQVNVRYSCLFRENNLLFLCLRLGLSCTGMFSSPLFLDTTRFHHLPLERLWTLFFCDIFKNGCICPEACSRICRCRCWGWNFQGYLFEGLSGPMVSQLRDILSLSCYLINIRRIDRVVLLFYPMWVQSSFFSSLGYAYSKLKTVFFDNRDFTFVCPTEILAFNDSLQAFKGINTTVIGQYTHAYLIFSRSHLFS